MVYIPVGSDSVSNIKSHVLGYANTVECIEKIRVLGCEPTELPAKKNTMLEDGVLLRRRSSAQGHLPSHAAGYRQCFCFQFYFGGKLWSRKHAFCIMKTYFLEVDVADISTAKESLDTIYDRYLFKQRCFS